MAIPRLHEPFGGFLNGDVGAEGVGSFAHPARDDLVLGIGAITHRDDDVVFGDDPDETSSIDDRQTVGLTINHPIGRLGECRLGPHHFGRTPNECLELHKRNDSPACGRAIWLTAIGYQLSASDSERTRPGGRDVVSHTTERKLFRERPTADSRSRRAEGSATEGPAL